MSRIKGTTERQTLFLRAFRTHQSGPPPELWPSPAIFRRWMRRPTFARAVDSLLDAVRLQTDFHLAFAALHSARQVACSAAAPPNPDVPAPKLPDPNQLLRLAHLRQRFSAHPAASANGQPKPDNDKDKTPVISEREFVRQISGEDGVKAYDELVEMRRARALRESQNQQPPPSTP
jgi:hypothetical protein